MNDLKPHKHGDEGIGSTHSCCKRRLKEMGGKATCCVCDPHLPCDFRPNANMKKPDIKVKKYKQIKLY